MDEAPHGFRRPEDEALFKKATQDPAIIPDRVGPAIEGYFRIPAVWIGSAPRPEDVIHLNPLIHHKTVLRKTLSCGIKVCVLRDGTFLFDFSLWSLAPITIIPGFRIPDSKMPYKATAEHHRAQELAESRAVIRAQVMNVHQACLTSSEAIVKRRGAAMGFPVTAWNTIKALTFDTDLPYHDDTEDTHALARNVLNNKDKIPRSRPFGRRTLELEVVEHSLASLDAILAKDNLGLLQIIEAAYMAANRQRERRFGEAVVLSWSVCEQLIFSMWQDLLGGPKSDDDAVNRMPKERTEKLSGRDYTASVVIESLELAGKIERELYRRLEIARKARNNWVHKMKAPKERECYVSISAAELLLYKTRNLRLSLQSGGRGGVPQWPI